MVRVQQHLPGWGCDSDCSLGDTGPRHRAQAASGEGIPSSLGIPFFWRRIHLIWAGLLGPGSHNSKVFLCSPAVISENPPSQFQLAFGYPEHGIHCQHHSIDSAYLNILWAFFCGWVLFWGGLFFLLFSTGKNTLKYWCLDDEPSLPIWFAMLPVLNSCTVNWLEFLRRLLLFFRLVTGHGWPVLVLTSVLKHLVFQMQLWSDPVVHNFVTSTDVFNDLTLWPVSVPFLLVWNSNSLQPLLNSFQNKPHFFLYLTLLCIKQQACFQGPLLNQL